MEGPIAERRFFLEGDPYKKPVLTFRLWAPYEQEGDYPLCRCEFVTAEGVREHEVSSVDSIDCIVICLSVAGSEIAGLNESVYGGQLRWEASPEGGRGLGLPTMEDHWPMAEGYKEAEGWAREHREPGSEPTGCEDKGNQH